MREHNNFFMKFLFLEHLITSPMVFYISEFKYWIAVHGFFLWTRLFANETKNFSTFLFSGLNRTQKIIFLRE